VCGSLAAGTLGRRGYRLAAADALEARIGRDPRWIFFHFPVVTRPVVQMLPSGLKMPLSVWMPISVTASALFVTVIGAAAGSWVVPPAGAPRPTT
jgi:hypothetical protein